MMQDFFYFFKHKTTFLGPLLHPCQLRVAFDPQGGEVVNLPRPLPSQIKTLILERQHIDGSLVHYWSNSKLCVDFTNHGPNSLISQYIGVIPLCHLNVSQHKYS